jgi:hypothetical protein
LFESVGALGDVSAVFHDGSSVLAG